MEGFLLKIVDMILELEKEKNRNGYSEILWML